MQDFNWDDFPETSAENALGPTLVVDPTEGSGQLPILDLFQHSAQPGVGNK